MILLMVVLAKCIPYLNGVAGGDDFQTIMIYKYLTSITNIHINSRTAVAPFAAME